MIDIGDKQITDRKALVEGKVYLQPETIAKIKNNQIPKGDVLASAKMAGIIASKKTPDFIPYCHPIPIEHVGMSFDFFDGGIVVTANVRSQTKTGVEMEGFAAVSGACLTIYDMCKSLDRAAIISEIKLLEKSGGKSGDFKRE